MCTRILCPNMLLRKVTNSPKPPQIPSQKNQSSTAVKKKKNQDVLKLLIDAVDLYQP